MKDRPILFSGPMVRALREGRKTQTRRIVKPQPPSVEAVREQCGASFSIQPGTWCGAPDKFFTCGPVQNVRELMGCEPGPWVCPYGQPGDLLIVASEIPGVSRNYCAGTDGRIYSRSRGTWRPLKEWRQPKGYSTVTIMDGGKKRSMTVHRLVCSAFYGPAPDGAQVRHLDGNPDNGKPFNLAWGTQEENWRDRRAHGNGVEGEKHHAAKFTDEERSHIRWAIEHGLCSQRAAARALGVSFCAVNGIVAGNELTAVEQEAPLGRVPELTLRIKAVRVERLQEISEVDALAEGVPSLAADPYINAGQFLNCPSIAVARYAHLWESINGPDSWSANPWVWVIEFDAINANIDTIKEAA